MEKADEDISQLRDLLKIVIQLLKNIQEQFVRVIVDCTELKIERPSDFEIQSATYSTYKSRSTVVDLIGLSLTGVTMFVTDLIEGSVSDNDITFQSGQVSKLEEGDAIMAGRGCKDK